MTTSSKQLLMAGKATILNFAGVFPLDKIRPTTTTNTTAAYHFIVNNQTANLPGQHWLGVSVLPNSTAYIFDPLGLPPPQMLIQSLRRNLHVAGPINYNKTQIQRANSNNCGQLVLKHLTNKSYIT